MPMSRSKEMAAFNERLTRGSARDAEAAVDYSEEIVTCRTCDLTMAGEGIQKQKDPNQLELPFND